MGHSIQLRSLFGKSYHRSRACRHRRRLGLESLEGRALLAAVTFDFSSTVSSLFGSATYDAGDLVTGHVTFESTTLDSLPELPDVGVYNGAVVDASLQVGSDAMPFDVGIGIAVGNDFVGQDVFSVQFAVLEGEHSHEVELSFVDPTASAFDSDALTLPDDSKFAVRELKVGKLFLASPVQIALAQPPSVDAAIVALIGTVEDERLNTGLENSLLKKLNNALDSLLSASTEQRNDVANKIESFINAVEAQRGKGIDSSVADDLIANARAIIDSLAAA